MAQDMAKTASLVLMAAAFLAGASAGAAAQSASLDGAWTGGGKVTFPSGSEEAARCRVKYNRESPTTYVATASCATASGRVDQSANLERTSANTYRGSFYNAQFGLTGSIKVVVTGSSQSVLLDGGGASASLRLSR